MASAEALRVEVAFSPAPGVVELVELSLPAGATIADAIAASGLAARHPQADPARARVGIHGRTRAAGEALRDGDRVEIYRPLVVDPKEARRLRYRRDGVKPRRR